MILSKVYRPSGAAEEPGARGRAGQYSDCLLPPGAHLKSGMGGACLSGGLSQGRPSLRLHLPLPHTQQMRTLGTESSSPGKPTSPQPRPGTARPRPVPGRVTAGEAGRGRGGDARAPQRRFWDRGRVGRGAKGASLGTYRSCSPRGSS